jgi:anti-anti-sigma factor
MASCEVHVEQRDGVAVVTVTGEVTREAAAILETGYDRAVSTGDPQRVVLDFSPTTYINSTGIALIVGVLAKARADGLAVAAAGLSDHYRQIFEITRLSDFIEVCPDVESAVHSTVALG